MSYSLNLHCQRQISCGYLLGTNWNFGITPA